MDPEQYYMNIAFAARERANCTGRKVGAVLVARDRVIGTGYNGTPGGFTNCNEGGCWRCEQAQINAGLRGQKYDLCICVHAEQNALLTAAREGIHADATTIYTTLQPCFGCVKEALQAGVDGIIYWEHLGAYDNEDHLAEQYAALGEHMPDQITKLAKGLPSWSGQASDQAGLKGT